MDDVKNRVEAILFTTGRSMTIGSAGIVQEALQQLIEDYNNRNCALTIFSENGRYKLNIKKEYVALTSKLLSDAELDKPTQETLAIIAYKQPVLQCDVIKIRGNGAYDHIKTLREMEFITSEKQGRTRLLKLAPKFYDYFDVVADTLKSKFDEVEQKVGPCLEKQDSKTEEANNMPSEGSEKTQ